VIRGLLEFLDAPAAINFNLQPEDAISFFRAKGLRPTFAWQDMLREEHALSFTVAKMLDTDLLADVQESLAQALETGVPFQEWADTITQTLQARGWWGREAMVDPLTGQTIVAQLGSPARLKTIFRTNLQTAYAAGAWQQITEQADEAPFLLYDAVDDFRTRPEHAAWDGRVYPVGDKFWRDHYPPNGWNCRCSVIQLSQEDLDDLGLQQSAPAGGGTYQWENPRTGKVERIPDGLDPGFDYNAGAVRARELGRLANEKAEALSAELSDAASAGLAAAARQAEGKPAYPIPEYKPATSVAAAQNLAQELVNAQSSRRAPINASGNEVVRFSHPGARYSYDVREKKFYVAKYTGLDLQSANTINEWLEKAQAECDRLNIPRIRGLNTAAGARAWASMGDGVLAINKGWANESQNARFLQEQWEKSAQAYNAWDASQGNVGKRPSTAKEYYSSLKERRLSTLWHEFGHHIHQQLRVETVAEYNDPPLEATLQDNFKKTPRSERILPTTYSATNSKEYFAECYSLFKMGKIDKVPPDMLELIQKIDKGEIPSA
jgi:SPP1 gp7 family putative phage head morphogenesis protein